MGHEAEKLRCEGVYDVTVVHLVRLGGASHLYDAYELVLDWFDSALAGVGLPLRWVIAIQVSDYDRHY